jgi:hypothetical protein
MIHSQSSHAEEATGMISRSAKVEPTIRLSVPLLETGECTNMHLYLSQRSKRYSMVVNDPARRDIS